MGGIILAILFWLWTASGLSEPSKNIWPALRALDDWLNTPTHVRRGTVLSLCLTIILVMGIAALLWLRGLRARLNLDRISEKVRSVQTVLSAAARNEPLPTDELPPAFTSQPMKPPKPSVFGTPREKPPLPKPDDLTQPQRIMLMMLYREYPRPIGLSALAGVMGLRYPEAEQVCEKMAETTLITLTVGAHSPAAVFLTKAGRDYYLANGLDLVE